MTINLAPGAIYNETHEGGAIHIHLSGAGEIVSPRPVRIIEANLGDEVGINDNVEAVLIPGDKKGGSPEG